MFSVFVALVGKSICWWIVVLFGKWSILRYNDERLLIVSVLAIFLYVLFSTVYFENGYSCFVKLVVATVAIELRCAALLYYAHCSLLKLCWHSHRCNEQFRTHSTHTQIGFVQNETATRCTNSNASKNCLSYTSNLMLISSHEELPLRNNQTILSTQRWGKQKCNLRKFDNYIVFCVELQHLHFDEIFSIIQKKFDEFDDSLSCKHKDAGTNTIFSP